jgi:DNA replication protein DnaC
MGDYGMCIPDCPICGGLGYIRYDVDIHHEKFGKIEPCPNRKLIHWDVSCGVSLQEAQRLNWEKFTQTKAIETMRKKYDLLLKSGYGWLYIWGKPGNGKTIMAKASIIYAYQVLGYQARYTKLSDLINELRTSYDEEYGQMAYADKLKKIRKIKYLVVDELGRDRQTEFSKQSLSDIMDNRYEDATNQLTATVWVSNFSPEDILEPYQYDRIRDGRFNVLELKDLSNRPAMQYEKNEIEMWWHNY